MKTAIFAVIVYSICFIGVSAIPTNEGLLVRHTYCAAMTTLSLVVFAIVRKYGS